VPGDRVVVPAQCAQPERRSTVAGEGVIIAARARRSARCDGLAGEANLLLEDIRQLAQPLREMLRAVRQTARADAHDASGSVVLIEDALQSLHDVGMVLRVGAGADLAFLFARPVSRDD